MTSKIFLLHHNGAYEALLADFLIFCGIQVLPVYKHQEALELSQEKSFDLGIVDLHNDNDLALIQAIRKSSPTFPLLALIDQSADEGLINQSGLSEDQLIVLPVPLPHILNSALRVLSFEQSRHQSATPLNVGSLTLDIKTQKATIHETVISLTSTEYALLELLAENCQQAVSKDIIYPKVLGRPKGRFDRSIDVHVSSIRHKLKAAHCQDIAIESVRGVGYRLVKKTTESPA